MIRKSFRKKEVKIIPISDAHIGSPNCNIGLFEKTIHYIKKSKSNAILLGDLIDNFTLGKAEKRGIGYAYEQTCTPDDAIETVIKLLKGIRSQIICSYTGNHESWTFKETGIDVSRLISDNLDVPYERVSGHIIIKVRDYSYRFFCHHGFGNGATDTSAMNMFRKMESIAPDSDCYLAGHTHKLFIIKNSMYTSFNTRLHRKKYYINTGSFLEYKDSYAESFGLKPTATGVVKIKIFGDRWDLHASI